MFLKTKPENHVIFYEINMSMNIPVFLHYDDFLDITRVPTQAGFSHLYKMVNIFLQLVLNGSLSLNTWLALPKLIAT